jgi:hypothetical protein
MIFIAADERDVIRLRTNYRKDEEVYMYRTNVPADIARKFSPLFFLGALVFLQATHLSFLGARLVFLHGLR